MEFYLKEAFQSLKLLENERLDEEDFNLTADQGVIDELQSFVADDIEAPAEEEIIDVEADEVEDLQDNYIGKVILECDCCHTRIYKDKEDVIIDEETGLANVDEECPVCSNAFGWNVIGKIEPFKEDEFDKKPEDEEVEVDEVEITDDEIGEALKEELGKTNLKESLPLREDVEQVKELVSGWLYDHLLDLNDNLAQELHYQIPEYDVDWCNEDGMNAIAEQVNVDMDQYVGSLIDSLFANAPRMESLGEACEKNEECEGEDCDESCEKEEALEEEFEDPDKVGVDPDRAVEDDVKLETPMENPVEENPKIAVAEGLEDVQSEDAEKLIDPEEEPVKELNEGIENLSLDTEDTHMEMTADENGRVEVVTEPIHEEEVVETDAEMIAPLDAEEIAEIDNNEEQSAEEVAIEDEIEELPEDEFEMDEFDEESFDEIGESYLHRVYENVNSFNTSNVKYEKGRLTVEGLIKFNSGKEKATKFIFEKFKNTKRGKVVVEGMNDMFSKSSKAFMLKGTLSDKKFISESLTYNYNVKQINESNEAEVIRVYGRAVVKK